MLSLRFIIYFIPVVIHNIFFCPKKLGQDASLPKINLLKSFKVWLKVWRSWKLSSIFNHLIKSLFNFITFIFFRTSLLLLLTASNTCTFSQSLTISSKWEYLKKTFAARTNCHYYIIVIYKIFKFLELVAREGTWGEESGRRLHLKVNRC